MMIARMLPSVYDNVSKMSGKETAKYGLQTKKSQH